MDTKKTTDLSAIKAATQKDLARYRGLIMLCAGTGCLSGKSQEVRAALTTQLAAQKLAKDYLVVSTGCHGFCAVGPVMVLQPAGVLYHKVKPDDAADIVAGLANQAPVERLLYKHPETKKPCASLADIPIFAGQELIALRNKGLLDPEDINQAIARGGYEALRSTLTTKTPEAVVQEILDSGLRGRGGGGFPTGEKWRACRQAATERGEPPCVICNAGSFMNRSIIETDPHALLEGLLIGAYAVGAAEAIIYIRKDYQLARARLEKGIEQARQLGLIGPGILGTGFSCQLRLVRGAGAFVCGERSALFASLEGGVGEPRAKYVHHAESGYHGRPSVLNNAETWATVPFIISHGAKVFAAIGGRGVSAGKPPAAGTKVFSLLGKVKSSGLVEVPLGTTLRQILFARGGGVIDNRPFKAVQVGGPTGGLLPESQLDSAVDYASLSAAGTIMGSGSLVLMDDRSCVVDAARYFASQLADESCGKCTPCREGLYTLKNVLTRICDGKGTIADLALLEEAGQTIREASLCQLGGTAPNSVLTGLRYFRAEYERHVTDKQCPGGVCKALITFAITDACTGCMVCAKNCPVKAISGERKTLHVIDQAICTKCGVCREVCKFDAVEVQ